MAEQQKNDAGLGHDKSELEQLKQDIGNAERQRQSILKALQKKVPPVGKILDLLPLLCFFYNYRCQYLQEKLLGNIVSQIDQLRASIATKQDEMGTDLVDHLTPEERDSLSRLNPEITTLKERLIACRANRIEVCLCQNYLKSIYDISIQITCSFSIGFCRLKLEKRSLR